MKLGVCYYPEHWPEAMWAEDARRMADLGLTLVRIGEFAWSRIEPEPGRYDWDWLDRAVETLAGAGLQIILGTPTATPPKWLVDAHPDILPCDEHGRPRRFGSRRHYCFSSKTYAREAARIVEAMAARYGGHPAIVMWQTDNEYGCHETVESFSPDACATFRDWLADKHGTIEALNAAWGSVFWSQDYRSFAEIDPPMATVTEANPAHRLDWRRFSSDQVAAFNRMQVDILRKHAPGVPLTHNFMGHFTDFDHVRLAESLDVASWDSYPLGFLETAWWDRETKTRFTRQGHPDFAAFHHDLYRGLCGGRFGVMEQQPGPVNWARFNPAPLPGMVRLWTLEAAAHGADFVSYFRWRQAPFAQEQMHAGLNRPDNAPDRASDEAAAVRADLDRLGALGTGPADAALVFDYSAQWMLDIQPQGASFRYGELVFAVYTALRRAGLNVDVVSPHAALEGYKFVAIPSLPAASPGWLDRLLASGAQVLIGPRTGSKTADFQAANGFEGLPIKVVRVESLGPGVEMAGRIGDTPFRTGRWREVVEGEAAAIGAFDDGWGAAFALADWGVYLACWPCEVLLREAVTRLAARAGLPTREVPDGLRIRRAAGLVFAFNYDSAEIDLSGLAPPGADCLLGGPTLPPAGVAVWRD